MNNTAPQNTAAPIPLRWRIRNWLFRELFAAEYILLNDANARVERYAAEVRRAFDEKEDLRRSRAARFVLEGGLAEAEIERRLTGTIKTPVIEAVMALVDRKIVEMSDRATNPPTATNTADLRVYEAGGANAIAEFKARLQDLTKPAEEKPAAA